MQNFSDYFHESTVSIARDKLDPSVWSTLDNGDYVLNQGIRKQIELGLGSIGTILMIKEVYLVGSILTKKYDKESDIDVTVVAYSEDLSDETGRLTTERLFAVLKNINGKLADGTSHPINFYVTGEFKEENMDAIYDFTSDKWVKRPEERDIELTKGFDEFEDLAALVDAKTGDLLRQIVDYKELDELSGESLMNLEGRLQGKINNIDQLVGNLVQFKKNIKAKREAGFDKPMNPDEIREYGSKNNLPSNVIYKLFQKYYYWEMISKLHEILKNRDKGMEFISKINKAIADMVTHDESTSFENYYYLDEAFKKLKMPSLDWTKPKSRGKYKRRKYSLTPIMTDKNLSPVPKGELETPGGIRMLTTAQKIVNNAKKASAGIWKITTGQAIEVATQYHFRMPDRKKPIKHLGSTGIILWRKGPGRYILIKNKAIGDRLK